MSFINSLLKSLENKIQFRKNQIKIIYKQKYIFKDI